MTYAEGPDVVVVGSSVSGLHAAAALARSGLGVEVLERKTVADGPGRTWIVTPAIRRLVPDLDAPAVVHTTGVMEMLAGRAQARVQLADPDLIIERTELIAHLIRRAEAAGVKIRRGQDLLTVQPTGSRLLLTVRDRASGDTHALSARHLIGADGVRSTVAELMGTPPLQAVPVIQARVRLPGGYDPDVTRVWFERAITPYFVWLIPDSRETGVLGLVAEKSEGSRELLDRFLLSHGAVPLEYQGAMIPLHRRGLKLSWRFGRSRVLLVGDAAAQVKVTTVGGVVSGLRGADAAAQALIRGTSYRRELRASARELDLHGLIRWSMDRFAQDDYARMLDGVNARVGDVLYARDRDSMAGAFLRLLRAQPRFLALGVQSLLRPYRPGSGVPAHPRPRSSFGPVPLARSEAIEGD